MYVCNNCGNESLKWQGQCPFCKEWNSLKEFKETKEKNVKWEEKELKKIEDINMKNDRIITKSGELNNVLWGWIVPWSVILLSWEPGIWKSTLTLQLWSWIDKDIIYVSWEETEYQLSSRANRLGIKNEKLSILSESNIENTLKTLEKNRCDVLIIDSISVMNSSNISGVSWSISQIKYITELLVAYAKTTNTALFIIGHINKDWALAGPKTLEHMVDTVLFFEWDKFDDLRILRSLKNRFGTTSETGIFKMQEKWLVDIKNPGLEFVTSTEDAIWSSLSITLEWTRPLIIETESLITYTKFGYPKRSARWTNPSKLDLIIAVLWKYSKISLDSYDAYTNISRWLKIEEPGIDLSIAASIVSSKLNNPISKNTVFIWEISLTGKIKKVIQIEKRIKEAEKMWFKNIIIPESKEINSEKFKIKIIQVKNIWDLVIYLSKNN